MSPVKDYYGELVAQTLAELKNKVGKLPGYIEDIPNTPAAQKYKKLLKLSLDMAKMSSGENSEEIERIKNEIEMVDRRILQIKLSKMEKKLEKRGKT